MLLSLGVARLALRRRGEAVVAVLNKSSEIGGRTSWQFDLISSDDCSYDGLDLCIGRIGDKEGNELAVPTEFLWADDGDKGIVGDPRENVDDGVLS
jgi:hypothetical protein